MIVRAAAAAMLAVALAAAPASLRAQSGVKVESSLSTRTARVGEPVVLEIRIETRGSEPELIRLPRLPDGLQLQGSQDFSSMQVGFPGGTTRVTGKQLVLVPMRPDRYRIPPAEVQVDGRTYRSRPLDLLVGGRALRSGGAATGDEAVLRTFVSPETVYVGQQATYRAEAQFSGDASERLRGTPEYDPPSPPGFWIQDMPDADAMGTRSVGNAIYDVMSFHRALFPLAPGRYIIPPARMRYEIRRGFINAPDTRELRSDSLRLVVLPLPDAGRPAGFRGAVGMYRTRAWIEPRQVPAGEPALLTLEVEGEGNVKTVPPPDLPAIAGVTIDGPREESRPAPGGATLRGTMRFTWTLVPEKPGRIRIPPIAFSFFDPAARSYRTTTATIDPLVAVAGSPGEPRRAAPALALAPIALAAAGEPGPGWVHSTLFILAQVIPLLAVIGFLLWRRSRRTGAADRRAWRIERQRRVDRLRANVGMDGSVWLGDLAILIRDAVASLLSENGVRAASASQMEAVMRRRGVDEAMIEPLGAFLRRVEHLRYRPHPIPEDERLALLTHAEELIRRLDEVTRGGGRTRSGSALSGILLTLVITSMTPTAARAEVPTAPPGDEFTAGVGAYQARRFDEAAARFGAYLAEHPRDAAAWYDLGNAEYRAGRRGSAVRAWASALRLRPGDDHARRNLRLAGASRWLLSSVAPWPPIRSEQALLLASGAWFAAGGAAIAWIVTKRRAALWAAGAALAIALFGLGAWGARQARPQAAVVVTRGAVLRDAPALRADTLKALDEGRGVLVREQRGAWIRAAEEGGEEGWVALHDVALVGVP